VRRLLAAVLLLLLAGCGFPGQSSADSLDTSVRELHLGQVVDGVPCLQDDLPVHHIHVHLGIYLDGNSVTVPAGIGVGRPWGVQPGGFVATGSCFAWLHTHDASGVVHIVTPEEKTFTLHQLFEVWGHPLSKGSALGVTESVTALVNGRHFGGDPPGIQLDNLENIVLEIGKLPSTPPPSLYDFATVNR
jgi:hypothetical protein